MTQNENDGPISTTEASTPANTLVVIPVPVTEDPTVVDRAMASAYPYPVLVVTNSPTGDRADIAWTGFGQGRTDTLRYAVADPHARSVAWFLLLDADDELVVGDSPVIIGEPDDTVLALQLQHGELRYWQPRLFHRSLLEGEGWGWQGRTHEWWAGPGPHANVRPEVLAYQVHEDGERRRTGRKLTEDFELLKADLADGSVDYRRCRLYLAQTLAEMGRKTEAWAGYLECLNDPDDWVQHRFVAGWRMLRMVAPDEHQWQAHLVVQLAELDPLRPEPHWWMVRDLARGRLADDPVLAMKIGNEVRDDYRRSAGSAEAVRASGPLFLDDEAMTWAWG